MRSSLTLLFLLAFVGAAWAGPFADLDRSIKSADPTTTIREVRASGLTKGDSHLADLLTASGKSPSDRAVSIRAYVSMRALMESAGPQARQTPIKQIKNSPLYRKPSDESGDNWVARAIERIRFDLPRERRPISGPGMDVGALQFVVYIVWGILALAVAVCLFLAIRAFRMKLLRRSKYRSMAMIEDDEPERSLDEWLELAARLEAEGRYREAVRCLYVACLLRYDEYRIARFDRTHTNWEHYHRIQASPTKPPGFDFRTPTSEFDHIWYGMRPTGLGEVHRFRDAYQELTRLLGKEVAGVR
ncbi:MAG TPA: hypothetical protein VKT78_15165 [Fimbriimonadaceae bacterium]|nr:hypothetical protein [Fimbriimonadaceae bacterium]